MVTDDSRHAIGDLARLTGTTPRTIRYYVAQGLLPAPSGAGPGAHYGPGHLARLRLIKRLQRQHLPLAAIRSQLETLSDAQVSELGQGAPAEAAPEGSALDYIRGVLGGVVPPASLPARPGRPTFAARAPLLSRLEAALPSEVAPAAMPRMRDVPAAPPPPVAAAPTTEPTLERSQWDRLSLGPNLELHVRRPLSRHEQRRVERLITIARQVLKEETP